jgi:hypothetical protein
VASFTEIVPIMPIVLNLQTTFIHAAEIPLKKLRENDEVPALK